MSTPRPRAPLPRRRLFPLTLFIAAVALLAFAGSAFAETKIGEGTSPPVPALPGEADLLKASANFDVGTGTVTVEITTREAPESMPEAERPSVNYLAGLVNAPTCTRQAIEAEVEKAQEEERELPFLPIVEILSGNRLLTPESTPPGVALAQAYGVYASSEKELATPEVFIPGSKSLSGATATVSATIPAAANGSFNCVEVAAQNFSGGAVPDSILFPLTTKPEPPPAQTGTTTGTTQAAPATPAPGALSIAKAKKPLKFKVGKWATVKVKVTNAGGSPTAPGSMRLKAAKGVIVKATRQKLPALLPGGSWTVSYKVKLTAKAKKSSTLSLVGSAGSLTAKGSLVLKTLG